MTKINNQKRIFSMVLSLGILTILTLSAVAIMPKVAKAEVCWSNSGYGYCDNTYNNNGYGYNNYNNGYNNNGYYTNTNSNYNTNSGYYGYYNNAYYYNNLTPAMNPTPIIYSVAPESLPPYIGSNTIVTLTGSNFISTSLAKFSNSYRPTSYIDSTHLAVTLNASDLQTTGSYTITVFNPMPGGGTSNGIAFNVNNRTVNNSVTYNTNPTPATRTITKVVYVPVANTQPNTTTGIVYPQNQNYGNGYNYNNANTAPNNTVQPNTYNNTQPNVNDNNGYNNLAANALFGTSVNGVSSFWPTGLVQWLLFAIMILIIVIMLRKVYSKNYFATPLKHE